MIGIKREIMILFLLLLFFNGLCHSCFFSYKEKIISNFGFCSPSLKISHQALRWLSNMSGGDARCALNTLQTLVTSHSQGTIKIAEAKEALQVLCVFHSLTIRNLKE